MKLPSSFPHGDVFGCEMEKAERPNSVEDLVEAAKIGDAERLAYLLDSGIEINETAEYVSMQFYQKFCKGNG